MVRASLGTREKPSFAPVGQVVFSAYSGFRPPLINDRLDITAIFLKRPLNQNIYSFMILLLTISDSDLTSTQQNVGDRR